MGTLIEIRDLSKVYERGRQKVEVLHHINLNIAEGDFLALMGPSGSGKTTLLNLVGGLDTPTGGSISVAGHRIDQLGAGALARWRASNVGFVFQFYNLMPTLSAQKNVELPLLLTKLSSAQRRKNAAIALQLVGLAERASHKPSELSGGQQQRVAIGRALATKPLLLLADEPTGNLDEATADQVLALTRDLVAQTGCGFLMVTHSVRLSATLDRHVNLSAGLIA
jgi:putative ABC transport system ATP-binding protein